MKLQITNDKLRITNLVKLLTVKRIVLSGALLVVLALLGGCAKKQVLGNLYEGVQMQNRQAAPADATQPTPGYDEYLRQRGEVISETAPTTH